MTYESPGRCPVCDSSLKIGRLVCPECSTSIEGKFEPCRFCKLGKEHRSFAEVFLRCRGNIREVERELGISYPTVRNRLEQLIIAMDIEGEQAFSMDHSSVEHHAAGRDVIGQLDRGEVSVDEALAMLKAPERKGS